MIKEGYFGDPARYDCQSSRIYLEAKAASFADLIESEIKKSVWIFKTEG